jgi:CRP-like cAMP-binding protein
MTPSEQVFPPPRNRLLAALPAVSLARLWPQLEPVELPLRHILQRPDTPITSIWFPETCMVSMLAVLEDGGSAEVGLVGPEGVVGLPILFGTDRDDLEAIVQRDGMALCMSVPGFREAVAADPALRDLLLRYALSYHRQVARTAVCNGRHHTEQRLVRWLLMAHDRIEGNQFPMTHEFLAMMLGVRRAGVSVAAGELQKAGLLRYERGTITIRDRPGLEHEACECYGVVRRSYDWLLGPARRPGGRAGRN